MNTLMFGRKTDLGQTVSLLLTTQGHDVTVPGWDLDDWINTPSALAAHLANHPDTIVIHDDMETDLWVEPIQACRRNNRITVLLAATCTMYGCPFLVWDRDWLPLTAADDHDRVTTPAETQRQEGLRYISPSQASVIIDTCFLRGEYWDKLLGPPPDGQPLSAVSRASRRLLVHTLIAERIVSIMSTLDDPRARGLYALQPPLPGRGKPVISDLHFAHLSGGTPAASNTTDRN